MALFGRKNNNDKDNDNKDISSQDNDLDAMIMAAIEETDEEQAQLKEEARKAHEARLEQNRIQAEKEEAFKKAMAELPNGGRRFYLMVEETKEEDGKIKVIGNLHGEAHVDDILYIYRPGGKVIETKLESVEAASGSKQADAAKNLRSTITLGDLSEDGNLPLEKTIPKFSIVSGVKRSDGKSGTPVDNPALVGATLEYKNFREDREYMGMLFGHVTGSAFLVPINPDAGGTTPDGKRKIGFLMLKNSASSTMPPAVPMFTDSAALAQWKDLFADGKKPSVIVATLPEMSKITSKTSPDIIINPFGPVPVQMPRKLVESLSDARAKIARDVLKQKQNGKMREAARIMVNEPMPSAETDAVRNALKTCASGITSISSLGLLEKIQGGKKSYLAIVDCPKDSASDTFKQLFEAAKPALSSIKSIDFALYADTPFADSYFATHSPDYVRIGNL